MTLLGRENAICTDVTYLLIEIIGNVQGEPNDITTPHKHIFKNKK